MSLRNRALASPVMAVCSLAVVLVLAAGSPSLQAQEQTPGASYRIDTVAGGSVGDGGPAVQAALDDPVSVAVDSAGNVYVTDPGNHRVRRIDTAGVISTIAGTGEEGFGGDGGPATDAQLGYPAGVAVDAAGNLYLADVVNHRVRRIDTAGVISTIAGTGEEGFGGDGGPATDAQLNYPAGVAVDGAGKVYVADVGNQRLRRIDTAGVISTIAGTGQSGFSGDGGPATDAALSYLRGVAVDAAGNVYVADERNQRVRRIDTAGVISTIAGTGQSGFSGDGGPATDAQLFYPAGVAVDAAGNVYVADELNQRVRRIDTAGVISTIAGTGEEGFGGDGGPATEAQLNYPTGVAVDAAGNVYVTDERNHRVRRIDTAGVISIFAGTGEEGFSGDGGPATDATLSYPVSLAVDAAGNLYLAGYESNRVRRIDTAGVISTIAGTGEEGFSGDGGPATVAQFDPGHDGFLSVATDAAGNVYVTDPGNHRVRRIDTAGVISTIAGTGEEGFGGDGGPATDAQLGYPAGVAVDAAGNLYLADVVNHRVRRIDTAGVISIFAGTGEEGFSGDGGPATDATLSYPVSLAVDAAGNLYLAGYESNRVRRIDTAGVISTIAGTGEEGFGGDGGPATDAHFDPGHDGFLSVATDAAGNVYVADSGNHRVRRIDTAGVISTIAGTGEEGFGGDGGPATDAQLGYPAGVAVDGAGNLFIADPGNHLVRKLTPSGGSGTPPAGTESFSIPDRGGQSTTSSGTAETLRVGYGRIRADAGSGTPSGIAIFGFRQNGVLISEAGVPASEPVQEGRIFAEVDGPVNTGLAIANPNDMPATISFYFTNTSGTRFAEGSFDLGAHQQTAKFLDQEPFNGGPSVLGTFTFTSSLPVAVVALRGFTNAAGEFLMTTLPVAPLSSTASDTVYFPHFADGGGWETQVVLVNPTDRTITGTAVFLGPGSDTAAATPVILTLDDGRTRSDFDYSIAPRSAQRFTTSNPPDGLTVGSVRATPNSGNAAPSGLVVFSFVSGEKTVSEAGVPALPTGSGFRVYVESAGTPGQAGSIRSGLAITNAGVATNTVTLEVTNLDGSLAVPPATLALPPSGQIARFVDEIFTLPDNFSGVLRVTSTSELAIVGLRLRTNENGELKMTMTPPSNETGPSTTADVFFPHIADSGGWSTQFILYSGTAGQTAAGTLSFIDTSGQPLDLPTQNSVSEGSASPD